MTAPSTESSIATAIPSVMIAQGCVLTETGGSPRVPAYALTVSRPSTTPAAAPSSPPVTPKNTPYCRKCLTIVPFS